METATLNGPRSGLMASEPRQIRYIKLGAGGGWVERCLAQGEVHFGYRMVPHELCAAGDWDAVAGIMAQERGSLSKITDAVREIRDFYELGPECLWITFEQGHLWWAYAEPEVLWLGDGEGHGPRMRKTRDGWRKVNLKGETLPMDGLSSRLTKVAAYRQTICRIEAEDYLLRRIRGEEEPMIIEARAARAGMLAVAGEMIAHLHWADFETLVDLLFLRNGWHRASRLGGSLKDADLILEQPATGERAFVPVKSAASQKVLDQSIAAFEAGSYDRLFFVCHSPRGELVSSSPRHHIWTGVRLAEAAVKAGLFDWLVARSR